MPRSGPIGPWNTEQDGSTSLSVTAEVEQFIVSELTQGRGISSVDADDNLLAKGIIDSHGVMELVAFLEERYGIAVGDEDLTPENFESVTRIDQFVVRKQNGQS
jgi:acyl carrier protein